MTIILIIFLFLYFRYTFAFFDEQTVDDIETDVLIEKPKKSTTSRQLYNTTEYLDKDDDSVDESQSKKSNGIDLMYLFSHFLDTCEETCILSALIDGFCRLILHGHYTSNAMISKLMLKFFIPTIDPELNQILGIFFETLVNQKKQECLQAALIETLFEIFEAPNESPIQEIKAETVVKFVVSSTQPIYCNAGSNIHNAIAISFIEVIIDNIENKELIKLLSKEMLTLELSDDDVSTGNIKMALDKLAEITMDPKCESNLKSFREMLNGTFKKQLTFSSLAVEITEGDDKNENCDEVNFDFFFF